MTVVLSRSVNYLRTCERTAGGRPTRGHRTHGASHGVARRARAGQLLGLVAQPERTVRVRVFEGVVGFHRAAEVDAAGAVGDDVVAAVAAVGGALLAVAA